MSNIKDLNKIKRNLLTLGLLTMGAITSGCAKNVDCNISDDHVHIYIDEDKKLEKYILGEKDHKGDYIRTNDYVLLDEEIKNMCENDLLLVSDNIDYISKIIDNHKPSRKSYVYGYIYVNYWGYEWKEIPLDEYTTDKVKDITYNYKFYKINDKGELEYKYFDSLDDLDREYKYFKVSNLVNENESDSYYLEKNKTYKNAK